MKVGQVRTVVPFEFDEEERNILIRAEEIIREMVDMLDTEELDHLGDENDQDNEWDGYTLMDLADELKQIRDLNLASAE